MIPSDADAESLSPADGGGRGRRTVSLFGLTIDALSMEETVARVEELIKEGGVHLQVSINADKVVKAQRDPGLVAIVNGADLVNADGQPVVWASRLLKQPLPERVAGIDLMVRLIEHAARSERRLYFLGAQPDIVERVIERVRREHATAIIAGGRDGFWTPAEDEAVATAVAATAPDIVFLAIPSPAKERFLDRWRHVMGAPFIMGVGGSFDVYAGKIPRAPRAMQRLGLEWAYRLAQEPRKMWRRYLVEDAGFLPLVVREWWRLRAPGRGRRPSTPGEDRTRPRILVVTNLYPSPSAPSFGTFIASRVHALRATGAECHVCAIRDAAVHRNTLVKYLRLAITTLAVGTVLAARRRRIDTVEAHIAFPTGWLAWPVARLHRAPLVLYVHGADVADLSRRSRAHAVLARALFRRADRVVVNSRYMEGQLNAMVSLPKGRIVVRSPGIENDKFSQTRATSNPVPRSGLLFVGRLHATKGVHVLLDAVALLARTRDVPPLTLIGDGPERSALEATAARYSLAATFLGAQPPDVVAASMQACDILVMPSSCQEALGLVAIEGMASGAIVVASRVGGLAETVVDGVTGIAVEPGDADALAAGIERALELRDDASERAALQRRASEAAAAHALERVVRESLTDYRSLGRR